jgi:hypothetical protein
MRTHTEIIMVLSDMETSDLPTTVDLALVLVITDLSLQWDLCLISPQLIT